MYVDNHKYKHLYTYIYTKSPSTLPCPILTTLIAVEKGLKKIRKNENFIKKINKLIKKGGKKCKGKSWVCGDGGGRERKGGRRRKKKSYQFMCQILTNKIMLMKR